MVTYAEVYHGRDCEPTNNSSKNFFSFDGQDQKKPQTPLWICL